MVHGWSWMNVSLGQPLKQMNQIYTYYYVLYSIILRISKIWYVSQADQHDKTNSVYQIFPA